jgi:hypothetical protein
MDGFDELIIGQQKAIIHDTVGLGNIQSLRKASMSQRKILQMVIGILAKISHCTLIILII